MLPAQPDNPLGFAERQDIVDFDNRLLSSLGWTWDAPDSVPLRKTRPLRGAVEEGRRLIEAHIEGDGPWLLKDPRFSLLMPWWRRILLDRFVAVVTVRPAMEVAVSLATRNGFPMPLGLALWAAHQRHLAAGLRGLPVILVSYAALTSDPPGVVGAVIDALERFGVPGPFDREGAASFIHPELRRASRPRADADRSLTDGLARIENAWPTDPTTVFDRFALDIAEPEAWETAILAVQRSVRHEQERTAAVQRSLQVAKADAAEQLSAMAKQLEDARVEAVALRARLPGAVANRTLRRLLRPAAHRLPRRSSVNPLFDAAWYSANYADVPSTPVRAYRHYQTRGAPEGLDPNPLFDTDWYLERNPGVRASGQDPLDHYLNVGARQGLDPGPGFASDWYLEHNPDVRAAGANPLLHYLRHGAREGRQPHPNFDGRHIASPGVARTAPRRGPIFGPALGIITTLRTRLVADAGARGGAVHARVVARVADAVRQSVPANTRLAVVSDGDPGLEALPGVITLPFPDHSDGDRPVRFTSSTSAIAHLEAVRARGAQHLLIPAYSWALGLPRFRRHLQSRYALASNGSEACSIYDLGLAGDDRGPSAAAELTGSVDEFRDRFARDPAILDWDTGSGVAEALPDCSVFSPPRFVDGRLPYLDASIDLVVVDASDPAAAAEANRVARAAVLSISGRGRDAGLSITWRPDVQAIAPASVSIIIPTYNRPGLMASCFRALRETLPPNVDAEVIIVDDGSTDGFDDLERLVQDDPRAVLLRNDVNAGFVTSVNRGAGAATGDFLVFLNNDTIPLPGWLRPLLRTFRDRPDAGVVGGKLVYPDGRLQEAGAIVFSDGSAANFGSGDPDPDAPEYSYLREVDYVSGALFVTRRSLFRDLGGFDPIYGFGYCEDSDYCFKVRAQGLRAYYQPESAIVHMEGGTSGTDVTQGPKRFQVINRETFVARWRSDLARQPSPPGQESARAA